MSTAPQRLSFLEKAGYSCGDAAANFVFLTMILFQLNYYTDVFGLSASAAATILLWPRLWDAAFDPIMGVLADRTVTRWGKFRPWILWTAVPWAIVMVLAYTKPHGFSTGALVLYAGLTNTALMTLYSMNNMPYAALGGVITGDLDERARLNSFRFVAVHIAQFIVGGFTLPLVAKFSEGHGRERGWTVAMAIWAVLCLVLFFVTFASTRERIRPVAQTKSSPRQDFADLLKNSPWKVMVVMTLVHFAILSFRGGALYNYFHHYVDKQAMFDFVDKLGLAAPPLPPGAPRPGGLLESLGYVVHGERGNLAVSNVADVFNSLMNMLSTGLMIVTILSSAGLARRFGKKAISVAGYALSSLTYFSFYLLGPTNTTGIVLLTVAWPVVYGPTIPLVWAIFADVADFSELKTGRRFTGMVFATIGFTLKAGLALGSATFLWIMSGAFGYDTRAPSAVNAVAGYRACLSIVVGLMFAACTALLAAYPLSKRATIEMANELAARREKTGAALTP